MEPIVYLDNSATTKPCEKAIEYMTRAMTECWGNPSSLHSLGIEAELAMKEARQTVARSLSCRDDEIIFTGSGTEANNIALLSVLSRKKTGTRVITTAIEHPSVLETVKRLENAGFEVIRLKPDRDGIVQPAALEQALTADTVLVSMMLVNNETGAVQPIEPAVRAVKRVAPNALFHCDAVQAYGKLPIHAGRLGVDLLSASGHKIHAPKGIGFLYRKKGVPLAPLITGGGQESGFRSGTEPLPLIRGLMGAVASLPPLERQLARQRELIQYARELFLPSGLIEFNSSEQALPFILNISVPGYRSETLLHFLDSRGIFVSSGSACAKSRGSYVLREMGLSPRRIDSALRLSFSRYNTEKDIDLLYAALCDAVKQLRKA